MRRSRRGHRALPNGAVGLAVSLEGGCVFGSVSEGDLTVEHGGSIDDGGWLAVHGH